MEREYHSYSGYRDGSSCYICGQKRTAEIHFDPHTSEFECPVCSWNVCDQPTNAVIECPDDRVRLQRIK